MQRSGDEDSERNNKWAGGMVEYHVPGYVHYCFGSAVIVLEAFLSEEEAYLDFANLLMFLDGRRDSTIFFLL